MLQTHGKCYINQNKRWVVMVVRNLNTNNGFGLHCISAPALGSLASGHLGEIRPDKAPVKIQAGLKHWCSRHTRRLFTTKSNETSLDLSSSEWFDGLTHSQ